MKQTIIIFALTAFALFSFSCTDKNKNGGTNTNSEPVAAASPSVEFSPTPESPRSGDLVKGTASGDITYKLVGIDSMSMNLEVRNETETVWELKIEPGTKLEPNSGDVQRMVVTEEYEVHLEPHEERKLVLEASCLDISKDAPSAEDERWGLKNSALLGQFISCAKNHLPSNVDKDERADLLQFSIWDARGATHEQWVHFWTDKEYSLEQAEAIIQENEPKIKAITGPCPALPSV